ncbi:hypothetical protein [Clostridium sp. FP1]|uniref:hypothetical protein n=1 Tax=Clostridium sp. FP1 TaxID=2724076 RepID=UPI0013E98ED9|nr:hypothetical protein [Clostridium sp. FP1]MBZ9635600.1 hypothetical protein [Clostridium sp. FP1]
MENIIYTDKTIKKIIIEAIKEFDKEQKYEQKKKVFHNTRLLMSNYNSLRNHVGNAVDDINKLKNHELQESNYIDITQGYDELYIYAIKKSKIKTLIMIAHIDVALEALKENQCKIGTNCKYEALEMFYLSEMRYEDIQEHFQCSKNTPGRWINQMLNELSILIFGLDGLKSYMM